MQEAGEISVCKGQGRKPLLNACDHQALKWYCLRNCHATMMDIATWAREYFGKSLSLNTVRRCIKKCNLKLYYANRKAFINFAQKPPLSSTGPKVIWDGPKDSGNVFSGQKIPHFSLFLEKTDIGFYVPKMKKTIQTVTNEKCKKQPLWWYGGASVPMAWVICIYVKVPLMQRLMLEFWRDICCRQDDNFSQELHVYFSRTISGLILHELQQRGFVGIECLTGLPAVQICLLLKMYGTSWRGESDNSDHRLLSSSSLVYTKNGQKLHFAKWDIFSSQMITKCN